MKTIYSNQGVTVTQEDDAVFMRIEGIALCEFTASEFMDIAKAMVFQCGVGVDKVYEV